MSNRKRYAWNASLFALFVGAILVPQSAFAGSLFVSVSPGSISSAASFQLTMSSSGMQSCTWSRLDNGAVWAWQNEPIPGGPGATVYDSGTLSGWVGPTTYEWFFECNDGGGGSYSASALISISGPVGLPEPVIDIFPASLSFPSTDLGSFADRTIQVTNVGDIGSFLTGATSVLNGPEFSCVSGCNYSNIPFLGSQIVTIRFAPVSAGAHNATVNFTGGGNASAPANGTGVWVPPPPAPPAPTVIVNPLGGNVPNIGSWNVDMTPNGNVVACEYYRTSVAYGDFAPAPLPAVFFTTGTQNWAGPGTVTYTFRCKDAFSQWSPYASGTVNIGGPTTPTGIINAPSSCTVPAGGTSCTVSMTWDTFNPVVATSYIHRDDIVPQLYAGLLGGPVNTSVGYANGTNVRTYTLLHNAQVLATKTITANCITGESWVGGVCTPDVVVVPSAVISVTPVPTMQFYGVSIGASDVKEYTVTNIGAAGSALTGNVTVTGLDFSCIYGCSYSNIGLSDTHKVGIKFAPTISAGPRNAQALFTGGGDAIRYMNGTALGITLTGSLDFGKVVINHTKALRLTVTNTSNLTDLGSGTFVTSAPFSCVQNCTYSLGPNAVHTFDIAFNPVASGFVSGTGSLSGVPDSTYTLTGIGTTRTFFFLER